MKNSVKEERLKMNITQQELADKLNVSRQTIFAIETGKYIPSTILSLKIGKVFKKQVEDIFVLERKD
ncbi:MAG: helix-turn-helix transcriptional regulator [Bacteroidetes bacterium]|nr:helix-turn-helix transcriptional regulator [Bacteroidota bacterium]MBS1591686.1 helix-turn-helix transcriptional regulator [Bacteroidota bacterium]